MVSFTHNDWDQHDIINDIIILTQQGAYMIYTIIPMKFKKYSSTKVLKHVNVLPKVNNFPYENLINMTPHDALQDYNPRTYNNSIRHQSQTKEKNINNSIIVKPLCKI